MRSPHARHCSDVIVVGGGPAGSSAALRLAQHGVKVTVLEKMALPRYKTCGGGIVGRAIRLLPSAVGHVIERRCYAAELHLRDADLHFVTRRPHPIIAMTMRHTLDWALLSAAQAVGAEVQAQCAVLDLTRRDNTLELATSRGSLFTRFVIAADGATSSVAAKAGWRENRALIPALEYEVAVEPRLFERFAHAARFDFGIVPCGYAWLFPKQAHFSIGVLSMRRGRINLHDLCMGYIKWLGLDPPVGMERHGFVIPVRRRPGPLARGRVLLTGDAAGFADPLTGEGISFAMQSGHLAAQAILDGALDEKGVSQAYHAALAQRLLPELRWARLLAHVMYDAPRLRAWCMRRRGQRLSEAITDVLTGERSYRRLLVNPTSYVKLFCQ